MQSQEEFLSANRSLDQMVSAMDEINTHGAKFPKSLRSSMKSPSRPTSWR